MTASLFFYQILALSFIAHLIVSGVALCYLLNRTKRHYLFVFSIFSVVAKVWMPQSRIVLAKRTKARTVALFPVLDVHAEELGNGLENCDERYVANSTTSFAGNQGSLGSFS